MPEYYARTCIEHPYGYRNKTLFPSAHILINASEHNSLNAESFAKEFKRFPVKLRYHPLLRARRPQNQGSNLIDLSLFNHIKNTPGKKIHCYGRPYLLTGKPVIA